MSVAVAAVAIVGFGCLLEFCVLSGSGDSVGVCGQVGVSVVVFRQLVFECCGGGDLKVP